MNEKFKIGDQVIMRTSGKPGMIIDVYTEPDMTNHYKVKFFVPNSRGYGYFEEYGSYFLQHELKERGKSWGEKRRK